MSNPDRAEHARLLVRKAVEDETAVEKLARDSEVADSVVGFHAQQAVEKLFKAVLAAEGAEYPFTHDLRHLIDLLSRAGRPLPSGLEHARRLAPWATEFRYGESIEDKLDRAGALDTIRAVREWAELAIGAAAGGGDPS